MRVRDEHGVQVARRLERGRVPAQVGDAPAEHRVGEEPHAVELDEHGAVPEPGQPGVAHAGAAAA